MDLQPIGRGFNSRLLRFMNDPGQVVHTHMPWFTKRYKLVPTKGRRCSVAGKVTVGQASHWPCVTDSVVYPPMGLMAWKREMSTPPKLHSEYYGIFLSSLSSIVPLTSRLHYHEPKHLLSLTSNSSYPLHYFHLSLSDNSMRNEYEKQE